MWVVALTASHAVAAAAFAFGLSSDVRTFADGLNATTQVHVARSGSDETGDGTAMNPYATIAIAVSRASPGTAVVIHSGVYAGGTFLSDVAGTAAAPIWIGGAVGESRPIIDGAAEGLHLVRCRYLVVHDLQVRNASGNGVNADDGGDVANPLASHHLVFCNLAIHDIGGAGNQDGLKLSGINDFCVLECDIARTGGGGSGSGIDMVGCHRGLIARCAFADGSGSGVQAKGGSDDIEVRWCRFSNAGLRAVNIGGATGFAFFRPPLSETTPNFEARNIRVLGNVFFGSDAPVAFVGCVDAVVAHNTMVNPKRWLLRILQETITSPPYTFGACANNAFESNLLFFSRAMLSTHINIGGNTHPATFSFASNLWYAHDNPAQSTPSLPAPETGGVCGQDPLLASPATGDVRIASSSPAIAAGVVPPHIGSDFDRACWCPLPAIGALEREHPGDTNCDAHVDIRDVLVILGALGAGSAIVVCPADVDGSGEVDLSDLLLVIARWG